MIKVILFMWFDIINIYTTSFGAVKKNPKTQPPKYITAFYVQCYRDATLV